MVADLHNTILLLIVTLTAGCVHNSVQAQQALACLLRRTIGSCGGKRNADLITLDFPLIEFLRNNAKCDRLNSCQSFLLRLAISKSARNVGHLCDLASVFLLLQPDYEVHLTYSATRTSSDSVNQLLLAFREPLHSFQGSLSIHDLPPGTRYLCFSLYLLHDFPAAQIITMFPGLSAKTWPFFSSALRVSRFIPSGSNWIRSGIH